MHSPSPTTVPVEQISESPGSFLEQMYFSRETDFIGDIVGDMVGDSVGNFVGDSVGDGEGAAVGTGVGSGEGGAVRGRTGSVGWSVGAAVGTGEGAAVGSVVGWLVPVSGFSATSASQSKLAGKPQNASGFMKSEPGLISMKLCPLPGMT